MQYSNKVIELLNKSYSPFHVVDNIKDELNQKGYIELKENESFILEEGKNYYLTRNGTALIAFNVPKNSKESSFRISASHTDSPTFKIKPNPVLNYKNVVSLNVEPYGGMIDSPWFDRPLSFAGRVFYFDRDGEMRSSLLNIDEDLLCIPNVCIHFNRNINDGYKYNAAKDMIPLLGIEKDFNFNEYLLKSIPQAKEILSFDLFLYNRDQAKLIGLNKEFLSSPKLDDLSSTYSVLLGFLDASPKYFNVYCAFDNEEVGSLTKQGAYGTFLSDTLERISLSLGLDYRKMIAKSLLVSVDNAHANHPNHPELTDQTTSVLLNEGIVIKYNADQRYTSDALSVANFKNITQKANISFQDYTNRSDLRGGSTLGNLSNNQISINSLDIGIPQLAMHSCNELCGIKDVEDMSILMKEFFSSEKEVKA